MKKTGHIWKCSNGSGSNGSGSSCKGNGSDRLVANHTNWRCHHHCDIFFCESQRQQPLRCCDRPPQSGSETSSPGITNNASQRSSTQSEAASPGVRSSASQRSGTFKDHEVRPLLGAFQSHQIDAGICLVSAAIPARHNASGPQPFSLWPSRTSTLHKRSQSTVG